MIFKTENVGRWKRSISGGNKNAWRIKSCSESYDYDYKCHISWSRSWSGSGTWNRIYKSSSQSKCK